MEDVIDAHQECRYVVAFQELLLLFEADGQNLGKSVSDPGGVAESMLDILIQPPEIIHDTFEYLREEPILFGNARCRDLGQQLDGADIESIILPLGGQQSKTLSTNCRDTQYPVAALVPVDDFCQCAGVVGRRGSNLAPLLNQQDAKGAVAFHATANHIQITRFEDAERQGSARKQDGIQREKRYLHIVAKYSPRGLGTQARIVRGEKNPRARRGQSRVRMNALGNKLVGHPACPTAGAQDAGFEFRRLRPGTISC